MKSTLGEFEEIVLLLVAVRHNEVYGVSIETAIEEKLQQNRICKIGDQRLFQRAERTHNSGNENNLVNSPPALTPSNAGAISGNEKDFKVTIHHELFVFQWRTPLL